VQTDAWSDQGHVDFFLRYVLLRCDCTSVLLLYCCGQVVGWLLDMLKSTRGEAVPKSGEAVRALTFFATSLSNPYMPSAQPVALSRSMTTLTPHCKSTRLWMLDIRLLGLQCDARTSMI
jgi:hypothetical protein